MKKEKKETAWEQQAKKKLEQVYLTYQTMMMQTAMNVLKQRQDSEDAIQNSLIAMARHMDAIKEIDSFRTAAYVRTVVKNAAIDIYRKKKETVLSYEEIGIEPADSFDMEQFVCDTEEVKGIVAAIMELEEDYREVLSLFYLNELTPGEIADVLNRPYNTVRSQINRGRKKLLRRIRQEQRRSGA